MQATGQRVYVAMDEYSWTHVLFANDESWYDDSPGGQYANDQYIAHYDPDGSFHLDGVS